VGGGGPVARLFRYALATPWRGLAGRDSDGGWRRLAIMRPSQRTQDRAARAARASSWGTRQRRRVDCLAAVPVAGDDSPADGQCVLATRPARRLGMSAVPGVATWVACNLGCKAVSETRTMGKSESR
jgi:hypothetical protein